MSHTANDGGEKYLANNHSGDSLCVQSGEAEQRRNIVQKREHHHAATEAQQTRKNAAEDSQCGESRDEGRG